MDALSGNSHGSPRASNLANFHFVYWTELGKVLAVLAHVPRRSPEQKLKLPRAAGTGWGKGGVI